MLSETELKKQLDAARQRGRTRIENTPPVLSAEYDATTGRVTVELSNGAKFEFPASRAHGLQGATHAQLAQVEVIGRYGLHWEDLDADLGVPELMDGIFGRQKYDFQTNPTCN